MWKWYDILLAAVAGVAAAALAFADALDQSDLAWAKDVVERAASTPEVNDGLWYAGSRLPHHPCLFAARGLTALVRRGVDVDQAKRQLLRLAGHPHDQVSAEAIGQALTLWDRDANFAFIALDLGLRLSIGARKATQSAYGYDPRPDEDRRARAVREALDHLDEREPWLALPKIPSAWVYAPPPEREIAAGRRAKLKPIWRESDELWLWNYAPRILARTPIELVVADPLRRELFLAMCSDLLAWTIDRLAPSWETETDDRRDRRSADLLEWRRSLFMFLGRVAAAIDAEQANRRFLEPVVRLEDELCLSLLEPFIDIYVSAAVLDPPAIRPGAIELLKRCVDRVVSDKAIARATDRDGQIYGHYLPGLIRTFCFIHVQAGGATRFANGDWTEVNLILPVVERLMNSAGAIPHVVTSFLTLCERAIEHYPSDRVVAQVLSVLTKNPATPPGWRGTFIPARIAALVHEMGSRTQPLPHALAEDMLRILDRLVDMGDRRAAALQTSEIFKDIRLALSGVPAAKAS